MRLTPPRRARRRMAGLVTPWMLSRRTLRWRLAVSRVSSLALPRGRTNVTTHRRPCRDPCRPCHDQTFYELSWGAARGRARMRVSRRARRGRRALLFQSCGPREKTASARSQKKRRAGKNGFFTLGPRDLAVTHQHPQQPTQMARTKVSRAPRSRPVAPLARALSRPMAAHARAPIDQPRQN